MKALLDFLSKGEPHFIFDFDGTLVPIQNDRHISQLPEKVETILKKLGQRHAVTILSGRSPEDLQLLFANLPVRLAPLNGLDVSVDPLLLNRLRTNLKEILGAEFADVQIECKGPLTALHFRHWNHPEREDRFENEILQKIRHHPLCGQWHVYSGKKVINIEPEPQGKLKFIQRYLQRHPSSPLFFAGDDTNDFEVITYSHPRLWPVWIKDLEGEIPPSSARQTFDSVDAFTSFLKQLSDTLSTRQPPSAA